MNAVYEIVAFRPAAAPTPALQIAQDRWLVFNRLPAVSEDFSVTDVTGKWVEMRVGAALLSNSVDVDELLAERTCARTVLFDCPAVIHRQDTGYTVWIERSYEHAFNTALQQAAAL